MTVSDLAGRIVGHRGARAVRPENSLSGFRYAIDHDVRFVELDVRLSADDCLVCSHPATVPTLNGGVAAIADVDSTDFETTFGDTAPPLLEKVLDLIGDSAGVVVEMKSDPEQPDFREDRLLATTLARVVHLRRSTQMSVPVVEVSSFDVDSLKALGDLEQIANALLVRSNVDTRKAVDLAIEAGVGSVHLHYSVVLRDLEFVATAAEKGCSITCWTVNDPNHASRLLDAGVRQVIVDDPVAMLRFLQQSNR